MITSRKAVFDLLLRVIKGGAYSNIALDSALNKSKLQGKDKAFSTALFYGVLERRITLEYLISKLTSGKKIDDDVKVALMMGLYQIIYMNSVPDSAAVNESVNLIKNKGAKGFVNGVLRQYLRNGDMLKDAENWLKYSCPRWLYDKWVKEYGEDATKQIAENSLGGTPTVCRVNTVKTTEDELIEILKSEGVTATKSGVKDALVLENIAVGESGAYKNGLFHIEDISAQNACFVLEPQENETIFDLCAAPGGKTFTIAELMNNKGKILAFDLHEKRAGLIKSGADRLGLTIIDAKAGNATVFNEEIGMADRVLCDVPCSGLGIIRRKPEIKYKNEADFERLPQIQFDILTNGARYVKDKGTLVYSTCTLSKAENEEVVERFLRENSDFTLTFMETTFPEALRDGFFTAKLERTK